MRIYHENRYCKGRRLCIRHFGHCTEYAPYDGEQKEITRRELLQSPGHEHAKLPALFAEHRVIHVLAGGTGPAAGDLFYANNTEVYLGVRGPVDAVIQAFIGGEGHQGREQL